jgi:hypothetical protein
MSSMPTSGKSARFYSSDYKLVARHNFRVARNRPGSMRSAEITAYKPTPNY